jgi:hypothetical protein
MNSMFSQQQIQKVCKLDVHANVHWQLVDGTNAAKESSDVASCWNASHFTPQS